MDKKKQFRIKSEASLKQLFTDFLTSRKALGATDKTIKTYREHFQAMSHYLNGDEPISQFQKRDIEAMIVEMRDKGLSPNSIKSYLITLRAFVNWGREELYWNVTVPPFKGRESIKEPYSDEELKRLLAKPNLRHCTFTEYRNWVV